MAWTGGGARSLLGVSRYAFALKPKWIFGHVIVIVLVIGFVNAGLWQIRRMHERQNYNDHVAANMVAPAAPLDEVLPRGSDFSTTTHELNRRVTATGRYLVDQEVVINAQASPDGVPGIWIVSPLLLRDGRVLLVNRGWLPSNGDVTAPPADARPPRGEVTVEGYVSETQPKTEGESPETNHAHQSSFLRIDVARIQRQFSRSLVPAFLLRTAQRPPDQGARKPAALDPPELSAGPHLGYVIQWFGFTLVALVGYPLLLWLIARDRERESPEPAATEDLPPGAFIDEDGIIDYTGVAAADMPGRGGGPLDG